jgi:putative hemolysin
MIAVEVLTLLLLLLINGLFAMAEIAVVSSRKARLHQRAENGDPRAAEALELARNPDEFLSTVQIGITLIGILAGAFGGATLSKLLEAKLSTIPVLAPYSGPLSVAVVVLTITFASLVIGELVPKRIGLHSPEKIAMAVVRPMRVLSNITKPLVWLLTLTTDLLVRLLHLRDSGEPSVTQAEIEVMIEQGAQAGVISEAESEVAQSVFRLAERRVGALMTRRMDIAWLDVDGGQEQARDIITKSGHSRYPVCQGRLDNVLGIVESQHLLVALLTEQPLDLHNMLRLPLFVPETLPAVQLLEIFYANAQHMAIVMDEYGGTQGLITLQDLLGVVVGDVTEPVEEAAARAVQREDGSWLFDGMVPVEDFRDLFDLDVLPGEVDNTFETLGGFVMAHLGRIPAVTDAFDWNGMRFEVMDMDGRRVDKILVSPLDSLPAIGEAE